MHEIPEMSDCSSKVPMESPVLGCLPSLTALPQNQTVTGSCGSRQPGLDFHQRIWVLPSSPHHCMRCYDECAFCVQGNVGNASNSLQATSASLGSGCNRVRTQPSASAWLSSCLPAKECTGMPSAVAAVEPVFRACGDAGKQNFPMSARISHPILRSVAESGDHPLWSRCCAVCHSWGAWSVGAAGSKRALPGFWSRPCL